MCVNFVTSGAEAQRITAAAKAQTVGQASTYEEERDIKIRILFIAGAILAIFLTAIVQSSAAPGTSQPTQMAPAPRITASLRSPTQTPHVVPSLPTEKRPPQCTFPLSQVTLVESTPEEYTFSEPEIVDIPGTNKAETEIVGWLPDNQQVLIVQNSRGTNEQTIELFNPQTGAVQIYAIRNRTEQPPAWVEGLNAVIYPETEVINFTTQQNGKYPLPHIDFQRQLWISRGNPENVQILEDVHLSGKYLSYFSVAVEPWEGQVVYFAPGDKELSRLNKSLEVQKTVSFDISQWEYRTQGRDLSISYMMAWRPGTSQIFIYSYAYGYIGYTFLLDVDSGQICELDFKGWAFTAKWSPNGQYLAIVRAQEPTYPVSSTDLAVLDMVTGELYTMGITPKGAPGRHYVSGIAWGPDNHHLLALGSIRSYPHCAPNCYDDTRLYLVDFISKQADSVFSTHKFTVNDIRTNLAWSPNGSMLLALCPSGVCLISVQRLDNGEEMP